MIDLISKYYDGNIILNPPLSGENLRHAKEILPEKLSRILEQSNGIQESMVNPNTNETMVISWIVYPYEMIVEETEFYNSTYFLGGTIFATNGAGEPYYIGDDGCVYQFEVIDNVEVVVADSLEEFFGK